MKPLTQDDYDELDGTNFGAILFAALFVAIPVLVALWMYMPK